MKSNPPAIEKDLVSGDRQPDSGGPGDEFSIEDALCERDESLKTIFDNINAVIVRLDKYGKITYVNARVEECFGYKPEEVIGKHFDKLGVFNTKDLPTLVELFGDAIRGKVTHYADELETRDKDGNRIYIEVKSTKVKKDGKVEGIISIIHNITERRKAEEALRASEEKFSKAFNSSLNPICILSLEGGKFIDVNDSYTRFTGYSRDEIIGRHAAELNIWVNKEDPAQILKMLMGKGNLYNLEINSRMKSGKVRTGLISADVINISGKPCMILSITDITERKRAEEALRLSEEKFSKVFNASLNPICIITVEDLKFIEINESFTRFIGYNREETIGHSSMELGLWVNEDDLNKMTMILMEKGRLYNHECRSRMKSGEIRTGLFSAEAMEIGGRMCLIYIITDITEQKWAEDALRESEEFTSSLLNSTPNPIFVTYLDTSIKYVNPAFEKLTGFSIADVIGMKAPYPWWPEEKKEAIATSLIQTQFGNGVKMEMAYQKKNGERFWVELNAIIINKNGERQYILVNWVDITERKQAEKSLKESEEKFSKAFSSASDAMAIFASKGGKFLEVNESYITLSGYSRDELIGHNADELNMWGNPADRERILKSTLDKGRVTHEEFSFRTKSGEIRTCLFSAEQINIGGEQRMIVVIQDITERKQMEMTIRDSEEKFSKAFNASANAISIKSLKTNRYIEVNDSFTRFTGYAREEVIGHIAGELDVWVNQEEQERWTDTIHKEGRVFNQEFSSRMKSGEIRIGLGSSDIINIGGEPCRMVVITDITERKQMETALRESEEKFFKAFNASANAICITSLKDRCFIEANESFTQFTGYARDEVIGHNADEFNLWVNDEELKKGMAALQKDGRVYNQEFRSRCKSGEIRVGLSSVEIINIGGKPCRMVVITDITERKKAEEALRESEEKFFKVFNASANAISITSGKENRFLDINESFTRFTGYTREDVIGRNAADLDLWADEEDKQRCFDTLRREGKVYNQEFRSRCKSGEIRVGLSSLEVITIKGEPCRILVITDITERKQAEEALRDSEEKFSKAFSASGNSICITSLEDNTIIDVNESLSRFTGYTREEVVGHTAAELGLWVDESELERFHNLIQKEGSIRNLEMHSRAKSGEIRVGLASAETIYIGGKPCRIVAITDITERKKAEEGLRLLSSVTQQVTDSTIVTDPDFKITYMNKAAQDLFGYSIDEMLGKDINFLDVAPISGSILKDMRDTLASGKTWAAILPKRRKDGSTFLCDCKRSPMYDEDGRLSSCIIVHHDITEQKEFEAKLKAHKQLIESILTSMPEGVLVTDSSNKIVLVNEAFRRIFQTGKKPIENKLLHETIRVEQLADLYKSMKKGNTDNNSLEFRYKVKNQEKIIACVIIKMGGGRMLLTFTDVSREREEEDKLYLMDRLASLGEMAAGLAHELNNPLTGILTLSQLLVTSDIPEQHKEDLQCVYDEAKRAANIVKNVLLFTRNNSYENGQSYVNEVVKEVLRLREHEAKTHNINVVTNLQDNLPEIPLEKYQLQQVFLNIILNAEAAMKETGRPGTLTVTTERANNHVNIMFSDNGCGIKKDVLPRIFDPFFTTKEIGKGTGLGLSICYGIIVKHAGKISVKTQVGKGTTFTIRMPIVN